MATDVTDHLPRYRSHKIVRAAQIAWWHQSGIGPINVHVSIDGTRHVIEALPNTFARGAAVVGDYLVVYDDGYISWSPRKAFEDGYTRVQAEPYRWQDRPALSQVDRKEVTPAMVKAAAGVLLRSGVLEGREHDVVPSGADLELVRRMLLVAFLEIKPLPSSPSPPQPPREEP